MSWPIPLETLKFGLINLETLNFLAYYLGTLSVSPY